MASPAGTEEQRQELPGAMAGGPHPAMVAELWVRPMALHPDVELTVHLRQGAEVDTAFKEGLRRPVPQWTSTGCTTSTWTLMNAFDS